MIADDGVHTTSGLTPPALAIGYKLAYTVIASRKSKPWSNPFIGGCTL